MRCQICGKESGFFPICSEHQEMSRRGEVSRCSACGTWYLTSAGCKTCKPDYSGPTSRTEIEKSEDGPIQSDRQNLDRVAHSRKDANEQSRFGQLVSFRLLSEVVLKDPPSDRHNTLQFDLAAKLLLDSQDSEARVDIKPFRHGPRAHIWYFRDSYNAPIMLRLVRMEMKDTHKQRAWCNFLKDISRVLPVVENNDVVEAYCLLFTDDKEYQRMPISCSIPGNLVNLSSDLSESGYYCFVCRIDKSNVEDVIDALSGNGAETGNSKDHPTSGSLQKCIDCRRVISNNPRKPRCYSCWKLWKDATS